MLRTFLYRRIRESYQLEGKERERNKILSEEREIRTFKKEGKKEEYVKWNLMIGTR